MLALTLQQMKASAGRLVAAGFAIALGTLFVATTILTGTAVSHSGFAEVRTALGEADAIINDPSYPDHPGFMAWRPADLEEVRELDGVAAADPLLSAFVEVELETGVAFVVVGPVPSDPRLQVGPDLIDGRAPAAEREVALSTTHADELGATLGESVTLRWWDAADTSGHGYVAVSFTLVGILEEQMLLRGAFVPDAWVTLPQLIGISGQPQDEQYSSIALVLEEDADLDAVTAGILASGPFARMDVTDAEDYARAASAAWNSWENWTVISMMSVFAAAALLVAGLVISNTFQVLVAQRARHLALLRCVGADVRQIRTSVMLEAALLGLVCSVLGVGLGAAFSTFTGRLVSNYYLGTTIDVFPRVTVASTLVTLAAGLGLALVSAWSAARSATRVSPVAALRPGQELEQASRSRRLAVAVAATALGAVVIAAGLVSGVAVRAGTPTYVSSAAETGAVLAVVPGALLAMAGALVGTALYVPALLRMLAVLLRRSVTASLAFSNAARNPARTAATTNAVIVGVVLVVAAWTGVATLRDSMIASLDDTFPLEIAAVADSELDAGQIALFEETPGLAGHTRLAQSRILDIYDADAQEGFPQDVGRLTAVLDGDPGGILRAPDAWADVPDGVLVIDPDGYSQLVDGSQVRVEGADGEWHELSVELRETQVYEYVVSPATLEAIAPGRQATLLWAALAPDADPDAVLAELTLRFEEYEASNPDAPTVWFDGARFQAAWFDEYATELSLMAMALLAVTVVIAFLGVANTMVLSVSERRREHAMLRALGLTRRQLRTAVAIEGTTVAVLGTVIGSGLGLVFGWIASTLATGPTGHTRLSVPWAVLGIVLAVALVLSLAVAILPGRHAARQPLLRSLTTD